jgi:hypothetical protein
VFFEPATEIVRMVDHDVARSKLPQQHALEKGLEDLAICRAFDGHHCPHAIHVERADHRGDSPRVARQDPSARSPRGARA